MSLSWYSGSAVSEQLFATPFLGCCRSRQQFCQFGVGCQNAALIIPHEPVRNEFLSQHRQRTPLACVILSVSTSPVAVPPVPNNTSCERTDADGDGLVFVEDMIKAFRATAHPEVVDGTRGKDHIQREFLESFVGKEINSIPCSW